MGISFIQAGRFIGLMLCRQVCRPFLIVLTISCPKDIILQNFCPSSGSYIPSTPSFTMLPEPLEGLIQMPYLWLNNLQPLIASTFIKQESLQLPAAYFKKCLWARMMVTLIYDDKNKNLKASLIACQFTYFTFYLLLFCVYYCLLSRMSVHHIYAEPLEVRRGNWNPWDWITVDHEPLCKC